MIPETVRIEGTLRTLDESWRTAAHDKIISIARNIAEGMGGSCEINIEKGYPALYNDPDLTKMAVEYSAQLLGKENVTELEMRMTSEDFAFYSRQFPAVFYRFGITDHEGHFNSRLHTATFNIDEKALYTGMINMAWLALSFLTHKK